MRGIRDSLHGYPFYINCFPEIDEDVKEEFDGG